MTIPRPDSSEYSPYYASYLDRVPQGDVLGLLGQQKKETLVLLKSLDEDQAAARYAPEKWSIKQLLGHLMDTERLFAFRALWIARRDPSPQPGMEQDDWVEAGSFDDRPWNQLLTEYELGRDATLALFRGFDPETLLRKGSANEVEFTVRSLAFIIAGHERHHLDVLGERYF